MLWRESPALAQQFDNAVQEGIHKSYIQRQVGFGDLSTVLPDVGTIDFTPLASDSTGISIGTQANMGVGLVNVINSVGNIFNSATNAVLGPIGTFYKAQAQIKQLQALANQPIITVPQVVGDVSSLNLLNASKNITSFTNPVVLIGGAALLIILLTRK